MSTTDLETEEEHDAFGGQPPLDESLAWRPDRTVARWMWAGVAALVFAAAVGVGAFFSSRNTAPPSTLSNAGANGPAGAQGSAGAQGAVPDGPGGRGPGMRDGTFGLLKSVNGSTLTLATRDGQTVTATTSSSTQITKIVNGAPQSVSLGDLTVDEPVMVTGTTGSDGTVAATAIRQGGGPRAGRGPGGPGGPGFGPPAGDDQQQQPSQQQPPAQQQDGRAA